MGEHTPWPHDETLHAWWVEPGRLLAGEYPGARTPGKAAKKLQLLIDAGIDSIVDLTTSQDPLEPYREQLRAVAEKVGPAFLLSHSRHGSHRPSRLRRDTDLHSGRDRFRQSSLPTLLGR
jgi:hypothetical protein